jgi:hypothetical protein
MDLKTKTLMIIYEAVPIIFMIALIKFIQNDIFLLLTYIAIIAVSFSARILQDDYIFFTFGFIAMTITEMYFISTGVETFKRNSLLGFIPVWLPFLWGYAFVAMKRAISIMKDETARKIKKNK